MDEQQQHSSIVRQLPQGSKLRQSQNSDLRSSTVGRPALKSHPRHRDAAALTGLVGMGLQGCIESQRSCESVIRGLGKSKPTKPSNRVRGSCQWMQSSSSTDASTDKQHQPYGTQWAPVQDSRLQGCTTVDGYVQQPLG
eukprot:GHUV01001450.1.p1 GENE.GHUV01001450.1~~GHUV01001450.1.p1  ORF type:complete len:139 (+),score=37.06 GHUV01001450.1:542-958(+)